MKEPVGLVGIGLVGTALAEHLLAAGYAVVGYDIVETRREHLQTLGGRLADGAGDVARQCRCVVLSLMTTDIVCQVVEGRGGLLEGGSPQYIIDTTTGDPDKAVALAARLATRNVTYLDATISGSSQEIRDRAAMMIIGGERASVDACRDLLEALVPQVFHVGPTGSGAKTKLAMNLVSGLQRLAVAEGLVFAERQGLDPATFAELLTRSAITSGWLHAKCEKMIRGDFEPPQARLAQHRKDVSLILAYAKKAGQVLPLSQAHLDVLDGAIAAGDGHLDNAAVVREIRRRHSDRPAT